MTLKPSDSCPECGNGIAFVMTDDGAGWLHVLEPRIEDDGSVVNQASETCP